ncbi:hypothetical protein [Pseudacidovorax intermedius]|uniref:hypothetical protein n=1 Tax=Pseudacidovorax intermedius TaxID=433924 RepID=UPI0012DC8131|nr:hypothetical protein [Pseudacidovorax intermedius]
MTLNDAARIELLELTVAELEEDLAAQDAEVAMLRELVLRLMQILHLNGTVRLQELASASAVAAAFSHADSGPSLKPTGSPLPKLLMDLAKKLDDLPGSTRSGT